MDRSVGVMSWPQRMSYGVGHALNDLTASMWFSYLIVYLQFVLEFDPSYAGLVLLFGQVADAIATPLLGFESTAACKDSVFCKRYGRRKLMHLIGTICVLVSFPFIFSSCPGCGKASVGALTAMLIPIVLIFQFGWAATQISHLSLIPILTPYEHERDILTVIRYAVDIMSDVTTYVVVWAVFDLTSTDQQVPRVVNPQYAPKFLVIVIVIEIIGAIFSLIFHIGVKEIKRSEIKPKKSSRVSRSEAYSQTESICSDTSSKHNLSWNEWLKEVTFYQVGLLYMLTRLFSNMSSVFTPLYLQEFLGANDDMMAKIPMVMNISSFVVSFAVPKFYSLIGKKCTFLLGAGIGIGSCAWIAVGEGSPYCSKGIYGVSILLGIASSLFVVSGLSFVHDLIGNSTESGSFVYGCMSFWDKMANGIAAMIIQRMHTSMCINCNWFYRNVMAYGVGGLAVVAGIILLTFLPKNLGKKNWSRRNRHDPLLPDSRPDLISYGALATSECVLPESRNTEDAILESNLS